MIPKLLNLPTIVFDELAEEGVNTDVNTEGRDGDGFVLLIVVYSLLGVIFLFVHDRANIKLDKVICLQILHEGIYHLLITRINIGFCIIRLSGNQV